MAAWAACAVAAVAAVAVCEVAALVPAVPEADPDELPLIVSRATTAGVRKAIEKPRKKQRMAIRRRARRSEPSRVIATAAP